MALPQKPVSTTVPCILLGGLTSSQGDDLPAAVPRLYARLRGGSWHQGSGVFPVHSWNRALPSLRPGSLSQGQGHCLLLGDKCATGRPGTGLRSSRERAVGGVPVTLPPLAATVIPVTQGVVNGCGGLCTCSRGDVGTGTVLGSHLPTGLETQGVQGWAACGTSLSLSLPPSLPLGQGWPGCIPEPSPGPASLKPWILTEDSMNPRSPAGR